MRTGATVSCGCVGRGHLEKRKTHGATEGGEHTPIYKAWKHMRARISAKAGDPMWESYGGRGITMCPEWGSFDRFLADMGAGWGPGLTLDRKDNDAGYSRENCRWATRQEQQRNRRTNVYVRAPEGVMLLCEAIEIHGVWRGRKLPRVPKPAPGGAK